MKAVTLAAPPADIRTEWRRLNDVIEDVQTMSQITSSHSHLIQVTLNDGGLLFDFSGLVNALAAKGINL